MSGYSRVPNDGGQISDEDLKRGFMDHRVIHSIFSLSENDLSRDELKSFADDHGRLIPSDTKFGKLCSLLNLQDVPKNEQKVTKCPGCMEEYEFDPQGEKNPLQLHCGQAHFFCRDCLKSNLKELKDFHTYDTYECPKCEKKCIVEKGSIETQQMSDSKREELEPILQRRLERLNELPPIVSQVLKLIREKVTIPDLYKKIREDKSLCEFVESKVKSGKLPDQKWVGILVDRLENSCLQNQSQAFKTVAARSLLARARGSWNFSRFDHRMKSIKSFETMRPYGFFARAVTAAIGAAAMNGAPSIFTESFVAVASNEMWELSGVTAAGAGVLFFIIEFGYNCYACRANGGEKCDWDELTRRTKDSIARWTCSSIGSAVGFPLGGYVALLVGASGPLCAFTFSFLLGGASYLLGYYLYDCISPDKDRYAKAAVAFLVLAFIRFVGKNPCSITIEELKGEKGENLNDKIRKKYYAAARVFHPDRNDPDDPAKTKRSKEEFQLLANQKQTVTKWLKDLELRGPLSDRKTITAINSLWEELQKSQNMSYESALGHCRAKKYIACLETAGAEHDTKNNVRLALQSGAARRHSRQYSVE